eukprot:scaffold41883_cov37-Prasinocladus_malaysianus.AAC.1
MLGAGKDSLAWKRMRRSRPGVDVEILEEKLCDWVRANTVSYTQMTDSMLQQQVGLAADFIWRYYEMSERQTDRRADMGAVRQQADRQTDRCKTDG